MDRQHPVKVKCYRGTYEQLGRDIMRLRYDATLAVIHGMALEAYDQMQNDAARGRKTLARLLAAVYIGLSGTRRALQLVWTLCRPHMQHELNKRPEISAGQIHGY